MYKLDEIISRLTSLKAEVESLIAECNSVTEVAEPAPFAERETTALIEEMDTLFPQEQEERRRRNLHRYAPADNRKKFVTTQRIKYEMGCDHKTLKEALRRTGITTFYPYEGSQQKHIFRWQVQTLKAAIRNVMASTTI